MTSTFLRAADNYSGPGLMGVWQGSVAERIEQGPV